MAEFAYELDGDGDAPVIVLRGEISAAAEAGLGDAYGRVQDRGAVVLDFTEVEYINSTGIALIVQILAAARKQGQAVRARGLAPHYREIFRITRLSDFMTITDE